MHYLRFVNFCFFFFFFSDQWRKTYHRPRMIYIFERSTSGEGERQAERERQSGKRIVRKKTRKNGWHRYYTTWDRLKIRHLFFSVDFIVRSLRAMECDFVSRPLDNVSRHRSSRTDSPRGGRFFFCPFSAPCARAGGNQ